MDRSSLSRSATVATQEWREGTDLIYAFVNDRLRRGGERDFVRVEALREEFRRYCGSPPCST